MSPISAARKKLYPPNWERISLLVREKAGWCCELCSARHGLEHPITRSYVVLTVHHINGDPRDNRRLNLIALCQRCHNRLDQPFRHPRKAAPTLPEINPSYRRRAKAYPLNVEAGKIFFGHYKT